MVNPRDIPDKMMKTNVVPGSRGHIGIQIGGKIEDKGAKHIGAESIGKNSTSQGSKSAGRVGTSNVNDAG